MRLTTLSFRLRPYGHNEAMAEPLILAVQGNVPQLDPASWVAPGATVVGKVTLGPNVSVWYGSTLRADVDSVTIGDGSNIQDGVTVHADPGFPVTIGTGVTVGHNAVIHGCTIEDNCLIGMGAVVLNGATIGEGSLVAAGAVVSQGTAVPARSLVAGVPGKVRRELSEGEIENTKANAAVYQYLMGIHRDAAPVPPTGKSPTSEE